MPKPLLQKKMTLAIHCSKNRSSSHHGISMIYRHGIADKHRECSPSNFTEDSEDDAKGSNTRDFMAIFREQLREIFGVVSRSSSTAFELCLLRDAQKCVAIANGKAGYHVPHNAEQNSWSRRFVMNSLRLAGYNVAVCESRWDQTTGYPAGNYEFIDVILGESKLEKERFFVDIDFRAQFEIARPSDEYSALLQKIPNLFVGRADKLCGIIKIMCHAARRSLRERAMHIPPWRKYRYMQSKWVGSYTRTTNPYSSPEKGALLQFPFSGIALKATGCDSSVNKDNNVTDGYLKAKSKRKEKGNEEVEPCDHFLIRAVQERHVNKVSGLATALAESGLTSSSSSTEPDTNPLIYLS